MRGRRPPSRWAEQLPTSLGGPLHPVAVDVPAVLVLEGVSAATGGWTPLFGWPPAWAARPSAAARLERAVARGGEGERGHLRDWQLCEQGWFAVDDTPARACAVVAEM